MTNFTASKLTDAGATLLSKKGLLVEFTKAETGSGTYCNGEDVSKMTSLKIPEQNFLFTSFNRTNDTVVNLKFLVSNKDLEQDYLYTEIGIYARDPDVGEILYAVYYALPENASTIRKYDGNFEYSIIMSLNIAVAPDGAVTVSGSGLYALAEDLQNHIMDDNKHISDVDRKSFLADTKNTAGATNSEEVLLLVGATSQGVNPQTYTRNKTYIGKDGKLYSQNKKVLACQSLLGNFTLTSGTPSDVGNININGYSCVMIFIANANGAILNSMLAMVGNTLNDSAKLYLENTSNFVQVSGLSSASTGKIISYGMSDGYKASFYGI